MIDHLLALIVFLHNPNSWKSQVYETKYNQVVNEYRIQNAAREKEAIKRAREATPSGAISWYPTGKSGNYTACWDEYVGKKFRIFYNFNELTVTCNATGNFRELGRVLDLDINAFEQLAPRTQGIIRGAKVEIVK